MVHYISTQPISAKKIRVFILKAKNFGHAAPADDWLKFQHAVNLENQGTVEDQRPEEMPLDLSAEFHIAADAFSIAYRRKLEKLGLEGPSTA